MKLRPLLVLSVCFLLLVSLSAQETRLIGRVASDAIPVREEAHPDATITGRLAEGETVELLRKEGARWYRIKREDLNGWVEERHVQLLTEVEFEGIEYRFPEGIAGSVTAETVNGFRDGRSGTSYPSHAVHTFSEYLVPDVSEHMRRIYFYRLDEESPYSLPAGKIASLRLLLDSLEIVPERDAVPVFPVPAAHQLFVAQVSRIKNDFVEGIRCVTFYGQDLFWPIPRNILYLFQGFAAEGSVWVSASFAVARPEMEIDTAPAAEGRAMFDQFRAFEAELANIVDGDFRPRLSDLDQILLSIR